MDITIVCSVLLRILDWFAKKKENFRLNSVANGLFDRISTLTLLVQLAEEIACQ
jgi:hypothetical protein